MGEFSISHINTDMIDLAPIGFSGIEKDQIPILKLTDGDSLAALCLIYSFSGQPEVHTAKTIVGEAGTVETIGSLCCVTIALSFCAGEHVAKCRL